MIKILVIDDDPGVLAYLSRLLESLGHQAVTANSGAEGLAKAADPTFQLILSDLAMPGEPSKMELIKQLRQMRPDCPLVVISGYPTPERLAECSELGVTEFLTKPFEINFIKGILSRLFPDTHA